MKLTLLEIYFLFFSFNFIDIYCGKWKKVVLDYSNSNGNYTENFEKTIRQHLKAVISELTKDGTVEVSYEIKPPKNSDNNIDKILFSILDKTISNLAPSLDFTISAEQTSEQTGNDRIVTLIEYHLTFAENKIVQNERTLHIDTDEDLTNNTEIVKFINSLYHDYERRSQANSSRIFKISLPSNSTESFVESVRKNFVNLFWKKKAKLEKDYFTEEKFQMNYSPEKELKDIEVTINFVTFNNPPTETKGKQIHVDSKRLDGNRFGKTPLPKEIDDYDFTFPPIRIGNSTVSAKEEIIEELQRHINKNERTWWWTRPSTALFTFEILNHMTSIETNQIVEDLYMDLEDVEPKSIIYPAHMRDKYVEIGLEMPPIKKMYLINFNHRFPHVIQDYIPIKSKTDLDELSSRVEEILDFQLFMEKRRDSGQKIYLNLFFEVERGETEDYYTNLVHRISEHLKTITAVKFISYEWKHKGKNHEILLVKVAMPYSVNRTRDGIHVVAEATGKKKNWFGWLRKLF